MDKKITGGCSACVSADERLVATFRNNTVYVHDLTSRTLTAKTVSNINWVAISPDKTLLAAKSTAGTLALISMESGAELCRNPMQKTEGEPMFFTADSRHVIDIDWGGRTMLLDCESGAFLLLDNTRPLPRCAFMHHDPFSKRIYRFMARTYGDSPGEIQCALLDERFLDPGHVRYETVRVCDTTLPDQLRGISFCAEHNYWYSLSERTLMRTDKDFVTVARIPLPQCSSVTPPDKVWVSPHEGFLFVSYGRQCDVRTTPPREYKEAPSLSVLYDMRTLSAVKSFGYEYVSDFTMYGKDTQYVISTWSGTFIGGVVGE